ncbi:MAG: hypothetical protein IT564_04525 [Rhodospirillales bacterium]|nr:hypothetical protein [Rhodospirillales bacterium]
MTPESKQRLTALAGLAWVAALFVAYHVANAGYYREKIAVFARFLFGT